MKGNGTTMASWPAVSGAVPKNAVQRGQVDQRGGEGQCDGDAAEQEPVAEHADRAQRRVVGADGERGADLAGDDAEPGDGGGLPVGVVERAAGPGGARPGASPRAGA